MRLKILFFTLISSMCFAMSEDPQNDANHAEHRAVAEFFQRMNDRYGGTPFSKGGLFRDNINLISLSVSIPNNESTSIDSTRKIFIDAVDQLLDCINSSKEFLPYLNHYPFTINDISIGVLFDGLDGHFIQGNNIASVKLYDFSDKIHYSKDIPGGKDSIGYLEDVYTETFPEAYKIVTGKEYIPPQITYNPVQQVEREIVEAFLEKKPGWTLVKEPFFCSNHEKSDFIRLQLQAPLTPTIDESRKIYIESLQDMIDIIISSDRFSHYFDEKALNYKDISFDIFFNKIEDPKIINEIRANQRGVKAESKLEYLQFKKELTRSYPYELTHDELYPEAHQKVTGRPLSPPVIPTASKNSNQKPSFRNIIKTIFGI